MIGNSGNNVLNGGGGSDVIVGGGGHDVLTGGSGADTFVFNSVTDSSVGNPDKITDFEVGRDWIDLRGIDADTTASGDQQFHFPEGQGATMHFTGHAGELIWNLSGDSWQVQADTNGDGQADFALSVHNAPNTLVTLGSDDFLF